MWHSLWALPTLMPLGITTWAAFGHIGVRDHRRSWLLTAVVYLILDAVAWTLVGSSPGSAVPALDTVALITLSVLWLAGIVHAMRVNINQRLPLLSVGASRRGR